MSHTQTNKTRTQDIKCWDCTCDNAPGGGLTEHVAFKDPKDTRAERGGYVCAGKTVKAEEGSRPQSSTLPVAERRTQDGGRNSVIRGSVSHCQDVGIYYQENGIQRGDLSREGTAANLGSCYRTVAAVLRWKKENVYSIQARDSLQMG